MIANLLSWVILWFALIGLATTIILCCSCIDNIVAERNKKKRRKERMRLVNRYCEESHHHVPWKCEEQALTMIMSDYPMGAVWKYLRNNTITLEEIKKRAERRVKKNEK